MEAIDEISQKIKNTPWFSQQFDIKTIKFLGHGSFGKVFEALSLKEGRKIAIKYMQFQTNQEFNVMVKEIEIMSALQRYGNIVKILDRVIEINSREIYIMMELADSNLNELIKQNKNKIKPELFLQIFSDLAFGLLGAHDDGFIHSDIKPANVLFFKNQDRKKLKNIQQINVSFPDLVFKLTDWGSGTSNNSGKTTRIKTGMSCTIEYAAPELLIEEKINLMKCDVFSLGMTMVNCCGVEFKDMKHISGISKKGKFNAEIEEILELVGPDYGETKEILRKMLCFDRHERMEITDVVSKLNELGKIPKNDVAGKFSINEDLAVFKFEEKKETQIKQIKPSQPKPKIVRIQSVFL